MNIFELNEKIFIFLNQKLANPILDFIVLWILLPSFSLLVILPFLFLFTKNKKNLGLYSLFCGFFLYWFGHSILKPFFGIERPFNLIEGARTIGPWHPSPYSFPSTTTMLAFGLVIPVFLHDRKIGSFLLILAVLVGFSVIYTGFHTLLDVLAGIFFDLIFIIFLEKILKWKKSE
jgi:undecaprenyl-diphosphatase